MTTLLGEARRATGDLGPLVAFRLTGLRGRSPRIVIVGAALVALVTGAFAILPAWLDGAQSSDRAFSMLLLLPTAYLAFLVTTTFAIIGAGGGRELLPRDEGAAFPVSPTTDHLGALMFVPLNIAWILQGWSLLGLTAFAAGAQNLWAVQITTLAWLFFGTALAQVIAWTVEGVRRRHRGTWVVRGTGALLALGVASLVVADRISAVLDQSPTLDAVVVALNGRHVNWRWAIGTALIIAAGIVAVVVGAYVAHLVARRPPREEFQADGHPIAPRAMARSELAALVRTDRSSVWRSVPLRRGFLILALMPGLVAAAGQLEWEMLPVLPGLVAAGSALLFGVNAWALDGVGAVWRDSLPGRPDVVFVARVWVLCEVLLVATTLTLVVAGVRAGGLPTSSEAAAVLATLVVVSLQVVARSMQWSVRRPFAMDLKSARGSPAPPLAMVRYSSYLALTSTLTGMMFAIAAQADDPRLALVLAVPFLLAAVRRLVITCREWSTPDTRAYVVATVSAR
jgi:hypothetical protein